MLRQFLYALPLIPLVACARDREQASGWTYGDLGAPGIVAEDATLRVSFGEPRRYGAMEGEGAIGRIGVVAANAEMVVVEDVHDCSFVIFSRQTRQPLRRIGRCGDGPGEFRHITSVSLLADSLLVGDRMGWRIRLFSPAGDDVRGLQLDTLPLDGVRGTRYAHLFGDTLALLTAALEPPAHSAQEAMDLRTTPAYLHLVSLRGDKPPRKLLHDGRMALRQIEARERITAGCVVRGGRHGAPHFVSINKWVPQVVAVKLDDRPAVTMNALIQDIPARPIPSRSTPGLLTPPAGTNDAVCDDSLAVLAYRTWSETDWQRIRREKLPPDLSYLVILLPESQQYRLVRIDRAPDHLLGRVAALDGGAVFMSHTSRYEHPVLLEVPFRIGAP